MRHATQSCTGPDVQAAHAWLRHFARMREMSIWTASSDVSGDIGANKSVSNDAFQDSFSMKFTGHSARNCMGSSGGMKMRMTACLLLACPWFTMLGLQSAHGETAPEWRLCTGNPDVDWTVRSRPAHC